MLSASAVGGRRAEAPERVRLRLRGCSRGRSVVSRAGSEGRRGCKDGVFGAGHCFRSREICEKSFHPLLGTVTLVVFPSRIRL